MAFEGFRASKNATQNITGGMFSPVTFQVEDFDTDNGFASSQYTVPVTLDGEVLVLFAGLRFASVARVSTLIEIDQGSGFIEIARQSIGDIDTFSMVAGPIQVSSGDVIQVNCIPTVAETINNVDTTFFSGYVVPNFSGFRAVQLTGDTQSFSTPTVITFPTERLDTDAGFAPSPGDEFVVPASWNDKKAAFYAGVQVDESDNFDLTIERSTDGGSNYSPIAGQRSRSPQVVTGATCDSGPIVVNTGDRIRVLVDPDSATVTAGFDESTFFGGHLIG